jgi:DNA-binding transcriptional LysR family regulator
MTRLPSLDLLRGFEAAARHMSFTRASAELHVTQSAVSRQIKLLERQLKISLFTRLNRALRLTAEGEALYRTAAAVLRQIDDAVERLTTGDQRLITVTATVSFAALWLVPRLGRFRKLEPGIDVRLAASNEITDLVRDRIDIAVRFCERRGAPAGAIALTGEEVFPVCSPQLMRERARPLRKPADLGHHVLLHYDDPAGQWPWLGWAQWLDAMDMSGLQSAGAARYSHYDQMIEAAIQGEGVALGRTPLIKRLLASGALVAPFTARRAGSREYFVIVSGRAAERPQVKQFVTWLQKEIRSDAELSSPVMGRTGTGARPSASRPLTRPVQ